MGQAVTIERYLNMLSEKTLDNSRQLKRDLHQRRNGMEDLYGVCFSSHANELKGGRYTAKFYISLSPDYVYIHRFAFKFVVMPIITGDEDPSEGRDWKMSIGTLDGDPVDITEYLCEQQDDDQLFHGEGVYPSKSLTDDVEDFYDILDVVSVMIAEGKEDEANAILSPKFKPVVISSLKPFSLDSYLYLKYSNTNR